MKNIYFVGKAGAGKSTYSNYLIKNYNYRLAKFAYPVYHLAEDYFGMRKKDRKLLQMIGTDIARTKIKDDYWIKQFKESMYIIEETYKKLGKEIPKFVLDDCRFENEHKELVDMGWIGIYINTNKETRIKRLTKRDGDAQIKTLNHKTETSIDEFKEELIQFDSNIPLKEAQKRLDSLIKYIRIYK